ncbi:MAG TPA: hypothetical protein VF604_07660 [Pyrinomonadaceae bacterium]|jgi:ketosteroid isomerase-like protein
MSKQTLVETVRKLDEAFNRRDIEAVMDFYEEDSVAVLEPDRLVRKSGNSRGV